ncbi:hypothetical protein BKA61DRAFT_644462 [Leptodontidium sp. MPI-SDFR-AT-0119]|nr:hypothetical protein BKA61DRAFT_644462 [Leptodontidium sp. MPI-SDFR-AT-0119]
MPRTLLTGANGFVAATILDQLVAAGHQVTGSVRSAAKGEQILARHPEYKGHVDFVVVSEYAKPGTWDEAFQSKDFDYVIHSAAPLLDDPNNKDFIKDFLTPSVDGATEILKSAKKYGKNIKSIVVTGSVNAMTTGQDIDTRVFTSKEWLPLTIEDAVKAQHPYFSYCVAKAESEKAIWKFVETEKPAFTVTNINYSSDVFHSLFNGTYETTPDTSFPSYIDVRDLAYAHIKSLTTPEVANQRFVVGGLHYSSQLAVNALKKVPELEGRLPKDNSEVEKYVKFGDVAEWNAKIGLTPRTPEETFGDAARKILEIEKEFA